MTIPQTLTFQIGRKMITIGGVGAIICSLPLMSAGMPAITAWAMIAGLFATVFTCGIVAFVLGAIVWDVQERRDGGGSENESS